MCSVLLTAAFIAAPSVDAHAGETESKTFFARGRELRLGGNCKDAIDEFRKARDSYPEGLGAIRNIAECEEELKRPASARRSWWALRVAVLESQSEKYLGWDKDAEAAFARLAPMVATVVVRVKNAPSPRVVIDGRLLTPSLLGTPIEEDLGPIEIVLEDGSAVPPSKKLVLEAGQKYEVELVGSGKKAKVEAPKNTDDGTPWLISGGIAFGLTGVALGGMIGAAVFRQDALSEVESLCPSLANCDPSLRDAQSRGEGATTAFNAFAVAAGLAGAAGVALTVIGVMPSSQGPVGSAEVSLHLSPSYVGVSGSF